jgi:aminoglycoside 6-adenylyltransferase
MSTISYDKLIRRTRRWALVNEQIQAVVIVGSMARSRAFFDIYSDLDFIIFTSDVKRLTLLDDWISELGRIWITDLDETGSGDPEWIVIFENGLKADFLIAQARPHLNLEQVIFNSRYRQVFMRGWQVLFDRRDSSAISDVDLGVELTLHLVEPLDFVKQFNRILILAHRAAKFINRQERWRGQLMLSQIRQQLLWFIERHAQISQTDKIDTWYDGRFIDHWAAPSIQQKLPDLFADYNLKDMVHALRACLSLTNLMALDIAQNEDIPYPNVGQKETLDWLVSVVLPPDLEKP